MVDARPDSEETRGLLQQVDQGDAQALDLLLTRHRPALLAFIEMRLDAGVRARLDPSDVVQEVQLEAVRRLPEFLKRRPMPFHLWLRKKAFERLLNVRRDHREAARRSVEREQRLPDRSSLLLAKPLLARGTSPSREVEAREFADRVARAVANLSDSDREILLMRHVEDLLYEEIASLLDIKPSAARQRYGRALLRLRKVLVSHGLMESQP